MLKSDLMGHKTHHSQLQLKVNSTYTFREAFCGLFHCGSLSCVGGMFAALWVDIIIKRCSSATSCTAEQQLVQVPEKDIYYKLSYC